VSEKEYGDLLKLRWEEYKAEQDLLRLNDVIRLSQDITANSYLVSTPIQITLLHYRLARAQMEVRLYTKSAELMKELLY
jgi:hypothetical protein